MTHDFAKKPKSPPRKNTKKKAPPKSQVPGWVWLFTGIVAGIFISFLGYLADVAPDTSSPEAPANPERSAAKQSEESGGGTRFDFYTLLPELEVVVPHQDVEQDREESAPAVYILQAGSFKNAQDADGLRAQLTLWGLEARVEAATVASGERWHRVLVGPFEDRSRLSKARGILIEHGINSLMYTLKDQG